MRNNNYYYVAHILSRLRIDVIKVIKATVNPVNAVMIRMTSMAIEVALVNSVQLKQLGRHIPEELSR